MTWWRMWIDLFRLRTDTEWSEYWCTYVAWTIGPCSERWNARQHPAANDNDNEWWIGS